MAAQEQTVVTVPPPSHQPQPQPKILIPETKYPSDSPMRHSPRGGDGDYSSPRRPLCAFIAILLLLAGTTALVVWLVYRPHKPKFAVVAVAVYALNTTTSQPLISTSMQFTILARNSNRRVSLHYDSLVAYVAYRNQVITAQVPLPAMNQGKKSTVAVSPVLEGEAVPVTVEVANGLAVDQTYGLVGLRVVVTGRLRWKAGAIKTVHYGLSVKCDVLVGLKKGVVGQVPLLSNPLCKVDV